MVHENIEDKKNISILFVLAILIVVFDISYMIFMNNRDPIKEDLPNQSESEIKNIEIMMFGKYMDEDISWRILDKQDGAVLLISEYILDYMEFGSSSDWDSSAVKKWLNDEFMKLTFSDDEMDMILFDDEADSYIFLLSAEEAEKYFEDNDDRIAKGRESVKEKDPYINRKTGGSNWWLRSSEIDSNYVPLVFDYGHIRDYGHYPRYNYGIRPALWVKID